ncbi:MAG: OmpH family outer membrane protein [Bacteroidetes bacterium]|nr:OmpH family outer membrane protein [Bacteroidota bacterium]
MKKIVPGMFVIAIMMVGINVAKAQQKIGHVDIQYVLTTLPEYKEVESQLKTLETQLTKQMQAKTQEFQEKLKEYQQTNQNMAEVVRLDKEKELTQLQESYAEFNQNAQTSLQQKTTELLNPLYKKIGDAIELVAQENGYSHILNVGVAQLDIVIYGDEKYDVSNLVLKKLGINPPAN